MAIKKAKTRISRAPRVPRGNRPTGCYFTQTGTTPDYKEVLVLRRFISDRGKILPQKYSSLSTKFQKLAAKEIKKARYMGLLPYTDRHAI